MSTTSNEKLEKIQETERRGNRKVAEALGIQSRQETVLLQIGFRFYQQGRFVEAKNIFEGLAVLDADNAYVHGILGAIYQKNGNDEEAISSYSMAIRLYGKDVNSLVNRGELFLKFGRFQEAAEDFARTIQFDPARKNPASNRARLLVAITQDVLKLGREKGMEAVLQERNNAGRSRS
jgi:Flp pilus assembly protein TadD